MLTSRSYSFILSTRKYFGGTVLETDERRVSCSSQVQSRLNTQCQNPGSSRAPYSLYGVRIPGYELLMQGPSEWCRRTESLRSC